jgi:hypothetical protein
MEMRILSLEQYRDLSQSLDVCLGCDVDHVSIEDLTPRAAPQYVAAQLFAVIAVGDRRARCLR